MNVFQATVSNRSYPPDTGGYQRIHGLVSGLDGVKFNVERYCCTGPISVLYSEGELISKSVNPESNVEEIRDYSLIYDIPKVINEFGLSRIPWQLIFKTPIRENILNRATSCDVAIGEDPYTAALLATRTELPTVYSSHNVEYMRYESTHNNLLSDKLSNAIRHIEKVACQHSDLVVCTTQSDAEIFSSFSTDTCVIPNGIPKSRLSDNYEEVNIKQLGISKDGDVAVFIGSNYYPNIEAAEWLINHWDESPRDCHLVLLGEMVDGIEQVHNRVHEVGYVDQLKPWLAMADVGLNPAKIGGGSNIKLLEYFAAGLPVVSTQFGASGFNIVDGENLVLSERKEFFDELSVLLSDPYLRERIGSAAFDTVQKEYTWEQLSNKLQKRLEGIL
ncbi:glycosyltransferase family 4 protein [Haloarcula argentinensis]|uniref:Glycosyltransferase subfamily 4-like N-terminal domain-containing protein n=1 Tax=Haloarcula argentinensis TaxID=43776 RepID=A0A830FH78_HALAR|nr:glycosyltransferase family 4 protein [Haloarcula argentinensis]GGM23926.1 hypothetical protein GCM10009006_01520 [Haloarcula argentinensis]